MNFNAIAFGFALVGAVAAYKWAENNGMKKHQVRVEKEATKKNDAAQIARKRVTADNAQRMLEPYYRD